MPGYILDFLNRFTKFVFWGSLSIGPYYVGLYVLTDYYGLWYLPTAVVGMIMVHVLNFFLQKMHTFRERTWHAVHRQMTIYGSWAVVNYLSALVILTGLTELAGLWYFWSQCVATVVVSTISYFVTERIFRL
jgi:putative flippase GtrA